MMAGMGPIERRVRADVEALVTGHPMGESLAELAFSLARSLDGEPGMLEAALSRELRACIGSLSGMGVDGVDELSDQLSSPVRRSEES